MRGNFNWLVLGGITMVNFIFAYCLDLYSDEAYYWMYSEFLDWGYFDHPPAVGAVIDLGYTLITNELGVRFFFVLATSLSFYAIYRLVKPENDRVFWLVSLSFFPLHLMGFMALPDVLIFLFCVLFMLAYKKYLKEQNIINALYVALTITAMVYSKYHGLIFVFFIVISNFKLFTKPSFYIIVIITLLLLSPHILWQIDHNYASLKYHFIDRSSKFKINYVSDYILGFLFYNGPFVFIALLTGIVKLKTSGDFDRGMKFLLYGFFLFFLFSSFKGRVEANWTFFVILPAIYLGLKSSVAKSKMLTYLCLSSIVLIALFRLYLLFPFGNLKGNRAMEFHGHQAFAESVRAAAKDRPIVANRYQIASVLSFYLKEHVPSINVSSRKNQYDFWEFADNLDNEPYAFVLNSKVKNHPIEDSVEHLFLGKHYIMLFDTLQHLRYPDITIEEAVAEGQEVKLVYRLNTVNKINTVQPIEIVYELYSENEKQFLYDQIDASYFNTDQVLTKTLVWSKSDLPITASIRLRDPNQMDWKVEQINITK